MQQSKHTCSRIYDHMSGKLDQKQCPVTRKAHKFGDSHTTAHGIVNSFHHEAEPKCEVVRKKNKAQS